MNGAEPASCLYYPAGHQTHHIMARRHHGQGQPGTVTGFDGECVRLRTVDGETVRWWHHHPLLLRASVAARGRAVLLITTLPVLQVGVRWFSSSIEPSLCSASAGVRS